MKTSKIREICHEINRSGLSTDLKRETFKTKYSEFAMDHPSLFEACLNPTFDLEMLEFMLCKRDEIENGLEIEQADKTVYDKLSETYILPYIDVPNGEDQSPTNEHSPVEESV